MTSTAQTPPGTAPNAQTANDTGQTPSAAPGATSLAHAPVAREGDHGVCGLCTSPMRFTDGRWIHGLHGEELCAP